MSIRRKGRDIVMQAIYQFQIRGGDRELISEFGWLDGKTNQAIFDFARTHFDGTIDHLEELDSLINGFLHNWDEKRVGNIERAILRMSAFSIKYCPDIPVEVVIDEAVFLAKKYCDDKSYKFINGVLDGIAGSLAKSKKQVKATVRRVSKKV